MKTNELMAQLTSGQRLEVSGNVVSLKDKDGAILAQYTASDGELWPINSELKSKPPSGYYRVTNLYVDPATKKLVVEYDDKVNG
jgi:hypothetical protein